MLRLRFFPRTVLPPLGLRELASDTTSLRQLSRKHSRNTSNTLGQPFFRGGSPMSVIRVRSQALSFRGTPCPIRAPGRSKPSEQAPVLGVPRRAGSAFVQLYADRRQWSSQFLQCYLQRPDD